MVFYFSGTGNSKWAAQNISKQVKDECFSIVKYKGSMDIQDKVIGLVFPIYAWGIPELMKSFIKSLSGIPSYVYVIATCGQDVGNTVKQVNKLIKVDSALSLIMPNNHIIMSEAYPEAICIELIKNAEVKLQSFIQVIENRECKTILDKRSLNTIKTCLINPLFNKFARQSNKFYATDKCISCGKCQSDCPVGTIKLVDGKPKWSRHCLMCLKCINTCPTCAIEHGTSTINRKRYVFKDTYLLDNKNDK